ncbi:alpha/beta fold hydrolase [uncultured Acetobacteroides sp.]|uniref:alpha/beta hydrolase n=1 Tax=uncultured Acetobacteroides sp. TaxID=1760811 RepID=UPI0029F55FFA|nr:alpha/beta fold hydrolase [uncultured Acetobacteroides sp.]
MEQIVRNLSTLAIILGLGCTAVFGIKPGGRYDTRSITQKYPNVTFTRVTTPDRYHLQLADIAPTGKDKHVTVLICYPDSGNVKEWLGYGMLLAERGYRAIMFDYRGFGGSDRFRIERDTLYCDEFCTDASTAYTYIKKNYPSSKVGLFGLSMGSIMTTALALKHKGDFIIGDSYVADLDSAIAKIEHIYGKKMTVPASSYDYNGDLAYVRQPMLLLNGRYDTICEPNSAAFGGSKHVEAIVYNGGHLEGPRALKEGYFGRIDRFIGGLDKDDMDERSSIHPYAILLSVISIGLIFQAIRRRRSFI